MQVFREARELAPAIVILDELDVIAAQRSFSSSDDAQVCSNSVCVVIVL